MHLGGEKMLRFRSLLVTGAAVSAPVANVSRAIHRVQGSRTPALCVSIRTGLMGAVGPGVAS